MNSKHILFLASFFCGVGILFLFKKIEASGRTRSIKIVYDPLFSEKMQERVSLFAKEQEKVFATPVVLTRVIKETFSSVQDVTIRSSHNGRFSILLTAHVPLFRFNDDSVLFKKGGVGNESDFKKEYVSSLARITFDTKDELKSQLSNVVGQWTRRVDSHLFKNYEVTWSDESCIFLKDKKFKNISLIGETNTYFTQELLDLCEMVKEKITAKKESFRRTWFIDVRFKNQIVAFWQ